MQAYSTILAILSAASVAVCIGVSSAIAQESVDPIPEARPANRYLKHWKESPFQKEAAPEPVAAVAKVSFAKDYALAGVVKKGNSHVAYLLNRKTQAMTRVATGEIKDGFQLIAVSKGENRGDFLATVEKNGERAVLQYDPVSIATAPITHSKGDEKKSSKSQSKENVQNGVQAIPHESTTATATAETQAAATSGNASLVNQSQPQVAETVIDPAQIAIERAKAASSTNQNSKARETPVSPFKPNRRKSTVPQK